MTRDKYGIPNYANSTLLRMPKSALLGYIRTIEHNWRSAEQTIEIQAENCKKLLAEERNKAIDDLLTKIKCDRTLLEKWQLEVIESKAKQLKGRCLEVNNDLISRQEVLNFIQGIKDKIIENQCFGDNTRKINMGDLNDILIFIRNMQTAYDIDKIIEQLEEHTRRERELELNSNEILENYHLGKAGGFIKAIDIVKGGGLNEEDM